MRRILARFLLPSRFWEDRGEELLAFWDAVGSERRHAGRWGRLTLHATWMWEVVVMAVRLRAQGMNGTGMEGTMRGSIRVALRGLRRNPLFGSVAVGTLTLGLAASITVFAVTWGILVAPLPYPDADRLVTLDRRGADVSSVAWPDFRDWRDRSGDYLPVAAHHETSVLLEWEDGATSIRGQRITHNLLDLVGVPPSMGRNFTPEEEAFDGPEAVILSHGLWVRQFGSDPEILGKAVRLAGSDMPVVGVMPEGFAFPHAGVDLWLPMHEDRALVEAGLTRGTRTLSFLSVLGRTVGDEALAVERFLAMTGQVDEANPREGLPGPVAATGLRDRIVGDLTVTLRFLLAAAILVLLVAGSNVAALSLSRADDRDREFRVRSAVGAGRATLWAQVMTESVVLSTLAALLGLPLTWALLQGVLTLAPEGLPRLGEIGLTPTAVGFGILMALLSGVLFGLPPAAKAARAGSWCSEGVRGGRGSLAGGTRLQQGLVMAQVATTVVLLIGATLLVRSYRALTGEELGFEPEAVVSALVVLPDGRYEGAEERDALYHRVLDAVRAQPGVVAATSTYSPPMAGNDLALTLLPEGEEGEDQARWAATVIIRDGYFETLGIPLVAGRDFGPEDRLGAPLVAIVTETMARELWPGQDPLGRRFTHSGGMRGTLDGFEPEFFPPEPYTVVGVVPDIRNQELSAEPGALFYRPHAQLTWGTQFLLVRVEGDPAALAESLPEVVWEAEPGLAVTQVSFLNQTLASTVALPRFRMLLLVAFAGATCLLALVGLYGVVTLNVARRRREMGLRMALGATRHEILGLVLGRGIGLAGVGALAGGLVAFLVSGSVESLLYGVAPTDGLTYLAVLVTVLGAAMAASWLPAARAGRVDPMGSLTEE